MKKLLLRVFILFGFVVGVLAPSAAVHAAPKSPSAPKVKNCAIFLGAPTEGQCDNRSTPGQLAIAYVKILKLLLDGKSITIQEALNTINSPTPTVPQNYIGPNENFYAGNRGLKLLAEQMTGANIDVWKLMQRKANELLEKLQLQTAEKQIAKTKTQKIFRPNFAKTLDLKELIPSKPPISGVLSLPTKSGKLVWLTTDLETSKVWVGIDEKAIGLSNIDVHGKLYSISLFETKDGRVFLAGLSKNDGKKASTNKEKISIYQIHNDKLLPINEIETEIETNPANFVAKLWEDRKGEINLTIMANDEPWSGGSGKETILESYNLHGRTGRLHIFHERPMHSFDILKAGDQTPFVLVFLNPQSHFTDHHPLPVGQRFVFDAQTLSVVHSLSKNPFDESTSGRPIYASFPDGHGIYIQDSKSSGKMMAFNTHDAPEFRELPGEIESTGFTPHITFTSQDYIEIYSRKDQHFLRHQLFFNGQSRELNRFTKRLSEMGKNLIVSELIPFHHPQMRDIVFETATASFAVRRLDDDDYFTEFKNDQFQFSTSFSLYSHPLITTDGEVYAIMHDNHKIKIHLIGFQGELNE